MPEIPYGESFSVEIRWDVEPIETGCHVLMSVRIPFNRQVIWRKAIERSVRDQTSTSMKQLVGTMRSQLEQAQAEADEKPAAPLTETRSTELAALVARLPEQYRDDVMRMLDLTMQQLGVPGSARGEESTAASVMKQRLLTVYTSAMRVGAQQLQGVVAGLRRVAGMAPQWYLVGLLVVLVVGFQVGLLVALHRTQSRCALQVERLESLLLRVGDDNV